MRKYIMFLMAIFIFSNCISTKEEIKQYARGLECNFIVTMKSEDNRNYFFSGYDKNRKHIEFQVGQFYDIYDFTESGDTILKKLGETNFTLIKKDTTLVFPLIIGGKTIEITCEDVKTSIVNYYYCFKVSKKQRQIKEDQYIILKGISKYGEKIYFSEPEFWDVYNSVEIGDSVVKEIGKTEIKLIKKDTVLVFPMYCDGVFK